VEQPTESRAIGRDWLFNDWMALTDTDEDHMRSVKNGSAHARQCVSLALGDGSHVPDELVGSVLDSAPCEVGPQDTWALVFDDEPVEHGIRAPAGDGVLGVGHGLDAGGLTKLVKKLVYGPPEVRFGGL
jgi:hypothetical protein